MARDSALFGGDLMFPSRSIRGTYCARDAFPLQRRFARDRFVRGVVRGEIGNLLTTMFAIDMGRRGSCAVALLLGESSLVARVIRPFFEKISLDDYRRDLSSSVPNRSGAPAEACPFHVLQGEWVAAREDPMKRKRICL